jgi:hypothetical protein
VPIGNATASGEKIAVPYDTDTIIGAPHFDTEAQLDRSQEDDLQTYYGIAYDGGSYDTTVAYTAGGATAHHEDASRASTEQIRNNGFRLRKY